MSMNLVDLDATGMEHACTEVRRLAEADGVAARRVELVGLMPAAELARWGEEFRAWSGLTEASTIEARAPDG